MDGGDLSAFKSQNLHPLHSSKYLIAANDSDIRPRIFKVPLVRKY